MLKPSLNILPPPQRVLWSELSSTPKQFALYGGTAIALRLGHRASVDFDFFGPEPFDPEKLRDSVPYLSGSVLRQVEENTLTVSVDRGGPVQVSFFGGLHLGQVEPFEAVEGPGFAVASLLDLAGMKASVVVKRAEVKDYLDLHALLTQAKIPLDAMLSAALIVFGDEFSPLLSLKAISYHDDLSPEDFPPSMRKDLAAAVKGVDLSNLPTLQPYKVRVPRK